MILRFNYCTKDSENNAEIINEMIVTLNVSRNENLSIKPEVSR